MFILEIKSTTSWLTIKVSIDISGDRHESENLNVYPTNDFQVCQHLQFLFTLEIMALLHQLLKDYDQRWNAALPFKCSIKLCHQRLNYITPKCHCYFTNKLYITNKTMINYQFILVMN